MLKYFYSRLPLRLKRMIRNSSPARPRFKNSNKIKKEILSRNNNNCDILIATNIGGNWPLISGDLAIGLGFIELGYNVKFVLCDKVLDACQLCEYTNLRENEFIESGPRNRLCNSCFDPSRKLLESLGLQVIRLSQYLSLMNECVRFNDVQSDIIEIAKSGYIRYFAKGSMNDNSKEEKVIFDKFKSAAEISYSAYLKLLSVEKPQLVIAHHGIYVPQGSVVSASKKLGIPIVTWLASYRSGTLLFAEGDTYHRTLPAERLDDFNFEYGQEQRDKVLRYLVDRETGANDWISFSTSSEKDRCIFEALELDRNKKTILMLTNVMWDANIHFNKNIFDNMSDWLFKTLEFIQEHEELQLVLRIHPAEVTGTIPSREKAADIIRHRFPKLPDNVRIVEPTNLNIGTYQLIEQTNCSIIYGTKAGIEIAARGKNVVVVGDAWCRNKGFTLDPKDEQQYYEILLSEQLYKPLADNKIELALKYAYYIFFIKMVRIDTLKPLSNFAPFVIDFQHKYLAEIRRDTNLISVLRDLQNKYLGPVIGR